MDTMVGKVLVVVNLEAPKKRGTDSESEKRFQEALLKFKEEQSQGITKVAYISAAEKINRKGHVFEEVSVYTLKLKDTAAVKVGDRVLLQGRKYTLDNGEKGFTKDSSIEVLK